MDRQNDIISIDSLFQAWEEFKKDKKKREDVLTFERNLEDNLFLLYKDLRNKRYKHSGYESFFVRDPKIRHIHKAKVRDRIVHHLISKKLEVIFDKTFYFHSYSCRKSKGTHKAVKVFAQLARKASCNNTSPLYILKCDIRKFFDNVDHQILTNLLKKKIDNPDLLLLLDEIIGSFASDYTIDPKIPKGMPIGNLTSQIFANIYMDPLDKYIKHTVKAEYYIRYADDFVIMNKDPDYLKQLIPQIAEFLKTNLSFSLHPNKVSIENYYLGTDFLGYVIFPHFIIPKTRTKRRMFKKIYKKVQELKSGKTTEESLNQTVQSYLGYISHGNTFKLTQDVKNKVWFWLKA